MKNSFSSIEFPASVTLTVGDRHDIVQAVILLGKSQAEAEAVAISIHNKIPGSVVRIEDGRIVIGEARVYEGLGIQRGTDESIQRHKGRVLGTLAANDNNYFKVSNS